MFETLVYLIGGLAAAIILVEALANFLRRDDASLAEHRASWAQVVGGGLIAAGLVFTAFELKETRSSNHRDQFTFGVLLVERDQPGNIAAGAKILTTIARSSKDYRTPVRYVLEEEWREALYEYVQGINPSNSSKWEEFKKTAYFKRPDLCVQVLRNFEEKWGNGESVLEAEPIYEIFLENRDIFCE